MPRLHAEKGNPQPFSGPAALFAVAQAVETALARYFELRTQGLVLEEHMEPDKSCGAFYAVFAGLPLVIERRASKDHAIEGSLALVTFRLRPCPSTPDAPDQPGDNLFTVRCQTAHPPRRAQTGKEVTDRPRISLLHGTRLAVQS
jgi:hypothetical protein